MTWGIGITAILAVPSAAVAYAPAPDRHIALAARFQVPQTCAAFFEPNHLVAVIFKDNQAMHAVFCKTQVKPATYRHRISLNALFKTGE